MGGVHDASAHDDALDGLRGLAALIVVASHASQQQLLLVPGLDLSGIGKSGVYLFFVISAYLLTRQWLLHFARPSSESRAARRWLLYLVRRAARIYPLYALVLLGAWWLRPSGLGVPIDTPALWRHLVLIEGRDLYWSVPVEFKYYLLIPAVAWLLARPVSTRVQVAGMALAVAALAVWHPPWAAPSNSTDLGYYLPIFLCGSLAAGWAVRRPAQASAKEHAGASGWRHGLDLLLLAALLGSIPSLARLAWPGATPDFLHQAFLPWGLFWSLLLVALVSGRLPGWAQVCRTAALRACGRWCFGLYLLHLPALLLARKLPVHEGVQAWAGLALSLLAAGLAYRWVERPAMNWAARLGAASSR